jgi:hypothetical protein
MTIRRYLLAAALIAAAGTSVAAAQAADPGARQHRIEQYAKSGVPATVAACLVDAEDRARTEGKLGAIEWTAPDRGASVVTTAKPAARSAPDTRVEVDGVGRDDASGGWAPLKAQCAYRKGRLATVALTPLPPSAPAAPLDLDLKPPVDASTESENAALAGAPSDAGSSPPVAPPSRSGSDGGSARSIRPTLQHLPADTPVREPPPNFLRDHRFGVELKSRF